MKILVDESVLKQALEALEYMHTEKCDYMRRNNLGDPLRENAARLAVPAITALRAALEQQEQSLPDNCDISQRMYCEYCGHIQVVKGSRYDGRNYFGSGYDWCDNCGDGKPEPIDVVMVDN